MIKEQEVKEITDVSYKEYGSDSGYLLGIEPRYRDSVQVIVKFVLEFMGEKNE